MRSKSLLLFSSLLSKFEILLSSSVLLSLKLLGLNLFSFFLEDSLNEDSSVLELITLGGKVEFVVKSTVNLLGLTILPQQSSENSLSSHPKNLGGHSALPSTFTFTSTSMVTFTLSLKVESSTGTRMHLLLTLHNQTILDELTDKNARVGLADLFHLVGINPNTLSSALQHSCCQSLLALETHHNSIQKQYSEKNNNFTIQLSSPLTINRNYKEEAWNLYVEGRLNPLDFINDSFV